MVVDMAGVAACTATDAAVLGGEGEGDNGIDAG